jgi:hypothetical protein
MCVSGIERGRSDVYFIDLLVDRNAERSVRCDSRTVRV